MAIYLKATQVEGRGDGEPAFREFTDSVFQLSATGLVQAIARAAAHFDRATQWYEGNEVTHIEVEQEGEGHNFAKIDGKRFFEFIERYKAGYISSLFSECREVIDTVNS